MRGLRSVAWSMIFIAVAGCGSGDGLKRVAIVGKLTAKGAPVDNCSVEFLPAGGGTPGQGGLGTTDGNGTFTLISSRKGDTGIPPGEYKVVLSRLVDGDGTVLPRDARQADYPDCQESIPPKYTEPETTTLRAQVTDAGGEIKIDVPEGLRSQRRRK